MERNEDLFDAIARGEDQTVILILNRDPKLAASSNDRGISALLWALYHQRRDLAEKIASYRPSLDAFENAALGRLDPLQELIATSPSLLNTKSCDGFSLLHYACFFSHFAIAKWLIGQGADITAVTPQPTNLSPIHSAVTARATPIVQLLLAEGADPNVQQAGGYTALMSAASHGDLEIMEALIRHGARVDVKSDQGKTAREMADAKGETEAVQFLDRNAEST